MADAAGEDGRAPGSRPPVLLSGAAIRWVALLSLLLFLWLVYELLGPFEIVCPGLSVTQSRVFELCGAVEQLRSSQWLGHYPVADATIGSGETNAGIEAAYAAVHDLAVRVFLNEDAGSIADVDGDGRPEYVDQWGSPFVYFAAADYDRAEVLGRTRMADGRTVTALPRRGRDGRLLHPKSYQLISAGPDGEFGTDDDITD